MNCMCERRRERETGREAEREFFVAESIAHGVFLMPSCNNTI